MIFKVSLLFFIKILYMQLKIAKNRLVAQKNSKISKLLQFFIAIN